MPPYTESNRYQKALLWEQAGVNAFNEPVVYEASEILVRWINKAGEMRNPQGTPVKTDASVISNQEIGIGSLMWEGSLAEWVGTGSELIDSGVMQVIAMSLTPDIKGRFIRHEVGLAYFRDTMPQIIPG